MKGNRTDNCIKDSKFKVRYCLKIICLFLINFTLSGQNEDKCGSSSTHWRPKWEETKGLPKDVLTCFVSPSSLLVVVFLGTGDGT